MTEFHVIIPARHASERLPGKMLLPIAGRALVLRALDVAMAANAASVTVATDDPRIAATVEEAGGQAILTGEHDSGTDRVAAAARRLGLADDALIVNLQGDEPLLPPLVLREVAGALEELADADMATLAVPLTDEEEFSDPDVVKVVVDTAGHALYFSRAPIPWHRDGRPDALGLDDALRHVGLYAYRNAYLQAFTRMRPSTLELIEKLEQLRALQNGARIAVARHGAAIPAGVDNEADVERVERVLGAQGEAIRLLFVCMGNICRSPTGQGVAETLIARRGLSSRIRVDSAGTHAYHIGEPPDPRSCRAAARRGYDLTRQRARRVDVSDFHRFDYILAMDRQNLEALERIRPRDATAKVQRLLDYSTLGIAEDVPDPYYGGAHGFEQVLDLVENAVDALIDHAASSTQEANDS